MIEIAVNAANAITIKLIHHILPQFLQKSPQENRTCFPTIDESDLISIEISKK